MRSGEKEYIITSCMDDGVEPGESEFNIVLPNNPLSKV